ncbi:heavy metal translocating P-type ATPase [Neobacillus endophyticus]|uniref:heavy metal translocating P-type ATPase n=1 Tax=Neobacillus endophyticus TaxID=2738405 RepID=UPI0028ACEAE8|nr:heavy metal translocating P-type ATPase [Neobacillus endophyticus]
MSDTVEKHVYRVQGFSCINCAAKFEKNVQHLDGVVDAKVNFGASKLTIYGTASLDELHHAGAFEKLTLFPEKGQLIPAPKEALWKRYFHLVLSALLLLVGYIFNMNILFAGAIILGGFSLFQTGLKNLIQLEFDMKTLMTIAIIGAAIIGQWEEGAVVVILFAISEVLEGFSMDKARASIRSLIEKKPAEALVVRNGTELMLKIEDIEIGDIILVKPGQMLAMDGIVLEGASSVNQAAITGEAVPVEKAAGDEVFAGTLNEEGFLKIKVMKSSEDSTIAKIIHLVEEAQAEKAQSQQFVDRFAKYYTPVIIAIAVLVAIVPPLFLTGGWQKWIYEGLAVLVVGCPCALVISTPVAIVTAIGNAARQGVLIKGGNFLEEMAAVKAIAFDKTGTLTKGTPIVTDFINFSDDEHLFTKVAALERQSQHPLAAAIMKKADNSVDQVEGFISITGKGIIGKINGIEYRIGNTRLFEEIPAEVHTHITSLKTQGKTVMIVGTSTEILALIAAADEVRESSKTVIYKLQQLGIKQTVLLTGDHEAAAEAAGYVAGVTDIAAELLPQDKLTFIKKLSSTYGKTAMIGDGVNDAPALAAADVGIAMGKAGTDAALETADIALMNDELNKLPFIINLSRKTVRIIKQNISLSLIVKLLALLLVIPGWLTLWIAIFADMGITLLVTLNGLRLLR